MAPTANRPTPRRKTWIAAGLALAGLLAAAALLNHCAASEDGLDSTPDTGGSASPTAPAETDAAPTEGPDPASQHAAQVAPEKERNVFSAAMADDRAELEPALQAVFDLLLPLTCALAEQNPNFRFLAFRIQLGSVAPKPDTPPASIVIGSVGPQIFAHNAYDRDDVKAVEAEAMNTLLPYRSHETTTLPGIGDRYDLETTLGIHRAQCGPPWGPAYGELPENPEEVE